MDSKEASNPGVIVRAQRHEWIKIIPSKTLTLYGFIRSFLRFPVISKLFDPFYVQPVFKRFDHHQREFSETMESLKILNFKTKLRVCSYSVNKKLTIYKNISALLTHICYTRQCVRNARRSKNWFLMISDPNIEKRI